MIQSGNMQARQAADWLIRELKKQGFVIQKYDAISTKSIYLKLDYGMSNSIRISDHKGHKHLKYRFNVECESAKKPSWKIQNGFLRLYFNSSKKQLRQLVLAINMNRSKKILRYGYKKYYECMYINKTEKSKNAQEHTFWAQAKEV